MERNGLFLAAALVPLLCGCNASRDVSYTVIKDDMSETPGKAQIVQELLVQPDITESDLRAILTGRYMEASQRSDFRYHDHPTIVAIHAYPSREHAESGMGQWIGMLLKTPSHSAPEITIHASVGQSSKEAMRFGLSEAQRREIYKKIVMAEDRGHKEGERKHPEDYARRAKRASELTKANKDELVREHNLTSDQLNDIAVEGTKKNWPMPGL